MEVAVICCDGIRHGTVLDIQYSHALYIYIHILHVSVCVYTLLLLKMTDMNDIRAMEALVFNLPNCLDCPMIGARLKKCGQFGQNGHPSDGR